MSKVNFKALAKRWQKVWSERKLFESDPVNGKRKFFITVPYPYVNGYLHIGHTYTDMRPEVLARFKRMSGFNVLFPFAFHATGTPLESVAKLVREGDSTQLSILKDMGFSESDIRKFKDPQHWIKTFGKAAKKDLSGFGLSVDWRRSFFTTDMNPRYSRFIQWQFRKLHAAGYLTQGKHPVVWCPKDKMAVGDHARSEGEGVMPQHMVLIKFKAGDVVLPCATLRPETVFGVTNVWVNPELVYAEALVDGETWVVVESAVQKLQAQKHNVQVVNTFKGVQLLKKHVHNPVTGSLVPVFPAAFVTESTGTGVVMSVPAHAPFDFVALEELKRENIIAQGVEPLPVVKVEGFGDIPAGELCRRHAVSSQKDSCLKDITAELYAKEFHTGSLLPITGKYVGKRVQEVKQELMNDLVQDGHAVLFYELSSQVVCRCRSTCLVSIVDDQWFLAYGKAEWKTKTHKALAACILYPEKVRAQFSHVIDWLQDWACARRLGLGTKLPQAKDWIIESLSDSTLYNAYYTIVHHLKNVPVSFCNDALFDYVFLGTGNVSKIKAESAIVERMREEFEYWYPVDFRTSGKDLVQNHLSFYLFNHAAIFPEKHWPVSIGVNGFVTLQNEKMSKSKGNVKYMRDLVRLWGADVVRMTILSNAEELDDVNWDDELAVSVSQKLTAWYDFALEQCGGGTESKADVDAWFMSKLHECVRDATSAMERTLFRSALQHGFFDLQRHFKWYVRRRGAVLNAPVVRCFIETQTLLLVPFVPHLCEEIWAKLHKKNLASLENWPVFDESIIKPDLDGVEELVSRLVDDIHAILSLVKVVRPREIVLIVAADWKGELVRFVKERQDKKMAELVAEAMGNALFRSKGSEATQLIQRLVKSGKIPPVVQYQEAEYAGVKNAVSFLSVVFGCSFVVEREQESKEEKARQALPGKPSILVRS